MSKTIENEMPKELTAWTKLSYGEIEYEMPKELAKHILATRKGPDQNVHPQVFLCRVVNEEFRIKGNCTKVTTY